MPKYAMRTFAGTSIAKILSAAILRSDRSCIHPAIATATRRSCAKLACKRISTHAKCVAHSDDSNQTAPNLHTRQTSEAFLEVEVLLIDAAALLQEQWVTDRSSLPTISHVAIGMKECMYSLEDELLKACIWLMQYLASCSSAGPSTLLNSIMPTSVVP